MKKQPKSVNCGRARAKASSKKNRTSQVSHLFPIIGIGASAGRLEALEQFLQHTPENNGMAFVIVQHLDLTRKGIMAELRGSNGNR